MIPKNGGDTLEVLRTPRDGGPTKNVGIMMMATQLHDLSGDVHEARERVLKAFERSKFGKCDEVDDCGLGSKWELEQKVILLESTIVMHENTIEYLNGRIEELTGEGIEFKETIAKKDETISDKENEIKGLETKLQKVHDDKIKCSQQWASERNELGKRYADLEDFLEEEQQKYDGIIDERDKIVEQGQKEISVMNQKISVWEVAMADSKQMVDHNVFLKGEIEGLENELEERNEFIEEWELKFKKLSQKIEDFKTAEKILLERVGLAEEECICYRLIIVERQAELLRRIAEYDILIKQLKDKIRMIEEHLAMTGRDCAATTSLLKHTRIQLADMECLKISCENKIKDLYEVIAEKDREREEFAQKMKEEMDILTNTNLDLFKRLMTIDQDLPYVSPHMEALPKIPTDFEVDNPMVCMRCRDGMVFVEQDVKLPMTGLEYKEKWEENQKEQERKDRESDSGTGSLNDFGFLNDITKNAFDGLDIELQKAVAEAPNPRPPLRLFEKRNQRPDLEYQAKGLGLACPYEHMVGSKRRKKNTRQLPSLRKPLNRRKSPMKQMPPLRPPVAGGLKLHNISRESSPNRDNGPNSPLPFALSPVSADTMRVMDSPQHGAKPLPIGNNGNLMPPYKATARVRHRYGYWYDKGKENREDPSHSLERDRKRSSSPEKRSTSPKRDRTHSPSIERQSGLRLLQLERQTMVHNPKRGNDSCSRKLNLSPKRTHRHGNEFAQLEDPGSPCNNPTDRKKNKLNIAEDGRMPTVRTVIERDENNPKTFLIERGETIASSRNLSPKSHALQWKSPS